MKVTRLFGSPHRTARRTLASDIGATPGGRPHDSLGKLVLGTEDCLRATRALCPLGPLRYLMSRRERGFVS
jgi:hypothetical protein